MATVAQQMGAVHKLDLTSDVTHLIVGNIDTPKYKYVAKSRRDIKVLSPSWLDAVRASWLEGGETDVTALEEEHALPTLSGLQICVTGFDDLSQRNAIQEMVMANGATYHGDLTKAVTHLIAVSPTGKKYEYACVWKIKTVSTEWLQDSLERGMALEETLYHPALPVEERGKGAVETRSVSPGLGKRTRSEDHVSQPLDPSRRKLRRTASTRLESQNDDIWADIGSGDGLAVKAPPRGEFDRPDTPTALGLKQPPKAPVVAGQSEARRVPESFTTNTLIFHRNGIKQAIHICGFSGKQTEVLRGYLETNGALVLTKEEALERVNKVAPDSNTASYRESDVRIIVPHDISQRDFEEIKKQGFHHSDDSVVSEWWVEQCLHRKALVDPLMTPLCNPFLTFPIPGFEKITVCPTAFSGIDLLHFSKAVKLMGGRYDETLSKETSVLVCNEQSPSQDKIKFALENGVAVVSVTWFWACIIRGELQPFDQYSISGFYRSQNQTQPSFYHPQRNPRSAAKEAPQPPRSNNGNGRSENAAPKRRIESEEPETNRTNSPAKSEPAFETNHIVTMETADESSLRALQDLPPAKTNSPKKPSPSPSPSPAPEVPTQPLIKQHPNGAEDQGSITGHLPQSEATELAELPESESVKDALPTQRTQSLNTAIETLRAHQKAKSAATTTTAGQNTSSASSESQRSAPLGRRRRPLGRAPSSGSAGLSRTNSRDHLTSSNTHPAVDPTSAAEDDYDVLDIAQHKAKTQEFAFRPSQALSYEDPEALAAREKLMKRLGASSDKDAARTRETFADQKGMRVESIGVVKDAAAGGRDEVGGRRRTLRRSAKEVEVLSP